MKRACCLFGLASGLSVACGGAEPHAANADSHAHGGSQAHSHHGDVHHDFSDAERWAKVFDDPARDAWQRPSEVVSLLALSPGMTVADVGAGTGYFEPHLSPAVGRSGRVIGLDVEKTLVAHMSARFAEAHLDNAEARVCPFDGTGLGPASVDRVLIVDTWHHIEHRERYAAHLAEVLRPGGFVAIVDFTLETEKGPPKRHRLAPDAVLAELRAGGLQAELATESLPDQYVAIGRRPASP